MQVGDTVEVRRIRTMQEDLWLPATVISVRADGVAFSVRAIRGSLTDNPQETHAALQTRMRGKTWR